MSVFGFLCMGANSYPVYKVRDCSQMAGDDLGDQSCICCVKGSDLHLECPHLSMRTVIRHNESFYIPIPDDRGRMDNELIKAPRKSLGKFEGLVSWGRNLQVFASSSKDVFLYRSECKLAAIKGSKRFVELLPLKPLGKTFYYYAGPLFGTSLRQYKAENPVISRYNIYFLARELLKVAAALERLEGRKFEVSNDTIFVRIRDARIEEIKVVALERGESSILQTIARAVIGVMEREEFKMSYGEEFADLIFQMRSDGWKWPNAESALKRLVEVVGGTVVSLDFLFEVNGVALPVRTTRRLRFKDFGEDEHNKQCKEIIAEAIKREYEQVFGKRLAVEFGTGIKYKSGKVVPYSMFFFQCLRENVGLRRPTVHVSSDGQIACDL